MTQQRTVAAGVRIRLVIYGQKISLILRLKDKTIKVITIKIQVTATNPSLKLTGINLKNMIPPDRWNNEYIGQFNRNSLIAENGWPHAYFFNGNSYSDPAELYFDILWDNTTEHFLGFSFATGLAGGGLNFLSTRAKPIGAIEGTSALSKIMRNVDKPLQKLKLSLPRRVDTPVGIPFVGKGLRWRATASVGAVGARWRRFWVGDCLRQNLALLLIVLKSNIEQLSGGHKDG